MNYRQCLDWNVSAFLASWLLKFKRKGIEKSVSNQTMLDNRAAMQSHSYGPTLYGSETGNN